MRKIEQKHIEKIRTDFQKMKTKEDFLNLLNFAKECIYSKNYHPFQLSQLNWYSNPKICLNRYNTFTIQKKTGGERVIHAPIKGLKILQKIIAFILQCVFEPHKCSYGFIPNKSIVDNAKSHSNKRYVYNIDLKDFFPSIDQARIWKCLQLAPFNLNNEYDETHALKPLSVSIKVFKVLNQNVNKKYSKFSTLKYLGSDLPAGKYKINLKEGGFLVFKVYQKKSAEFGKIIVIKNESNLELVKRVAIDTISKNESTVDVDFIVDHICAKLITHFFEKNIFPSNRQQIANIIASISCFAMEVERFNSVSNTWEVSNKNVLPQGAPTSPILTNIVCYKLDRRLAGLSKRFGLNYTRYADDITFSSSHNVYEKDGEFLNELNRIILGQGFTIKESKTRLQKAGFRQEVTGLLVGDKVNVQKRYTKQIRMWLYYWETYGLHKTESIFHDYYLKDKGNIKKQVPRLSLVLKGKLDFLKMVVGEKSTVYDSLLNRYNKLTFKKIPTANREFHLNFILNELLEKGLKSAMSKFQI